MVRQPPVYCTAEAEAVRQLTEIGVGQPSGSRKSLDCDKLKVLASEVVNFEPIVPDSRSKLHNGCTVAALDDDKGYLLPQALTL